MFRNYLVVSASAKTRETIASSLRSHGYTVTLAGSASEAPLVGKNVAVATVLLASVLADAGRDNVRKQIETMRPDCRVIALTSFASVRGTRDLLRFGEEDFLVSRGDLVELLREAREQGTETA